MTREPTLEERADHLLELDAKKRGVPLRRIGVIDRRRRAKVARVEIPMSAFEKRKDREGK